MAWSPSLSAVSIDLYHHHHQPVKMHLPFWLKMFEFVCSQTRFLFLSFFHIERYQMCCCRGAYYLIQTFHLSNWKKENSLIEIEANSAWCKKRDLCVCVQATSCLTRSLSPKTPQGSSVYWLSHSTTFPWLVYFLCALSTVVYVWWELFSSFSLFIHAPLQSRNWHYSTFLPASNDERGEVPIIFPFSVRMAENHFLTERVLCGTTVVAHSFL